MASVKIKKQIEEYLPLLTNHQQELILNMVKSILNVEESVERISIKEYNMELEESEKEIAAGKYVENSEVMKMMKEWKKKK